MDLDLETREREREREKREGEKTNHFSKKKIKDLDFILDAHLILC
jgi:hypothetical protein